MYVCDDISVCRRRVCIVCDDISGVGESVCVCDDISVCRRRVCMCVMIFQCVGGECVCVCVCRKCVCV